MMGGEEERIFEEGGRLEASCTYHFVRTGREEGTGLPEDKLRLLCVLWWWWEGGCVVLVCVNELGKEEERGKR